MNLQVALLREISVIIIATQDYHGSAIMAYKHCTPYIYGTYTYVDKGTELHYAWAELWMTP